MSPLLSFWILVFRTQHKLSGAKPLYHVCPSEDRWIIPTLCLIGKTVPCLSTLHLMADFIFPTQSLLSVSSQIAALPATTVRSVISGVPGWVRQTGLTLPWIPAQNRLHKRTASGLSWDSAGYWRTFSCFFNFKKESPGYRWAPRSLPFPLLRQLHPNR